MSMLLYGKSTSKYDKEKMVNDKLLLSSKNITSF